MKLDVTIAIEDLRDVPSLAREAEALGVDGLWTAETRHDPFLPLALAAEHTERVSLGTAIAVVMLIIGGVFSIIYIRALKPEVD